MSIRRHGESNVGALRDIQADREDMASPCDLKGKQILLSQCISMCATMTLSIGDAPSISQAVRIVRNLWDEERRWTSFAFLRGSPCTKGARHLDSDESSRTALILETGEWSFRCGNCLPSLPGTLRDMDDMTGKCPN
jgi:hypothetical protein